MTLEEKIRDVVLAEIANIEIQALTGINYFARENHEILTYLYNKKIIDDVSIEQALEKAVIKQAKNDYIFMQKVVKSADSHFIETKCFAYALEKEIFSDLELENISFGNCDDKKSYIESYRGKDTLGYFKNKLLNPVSFHFLKNTDECCCRP